MTLSDKFQQCGVECERGHTFEPPCCYRMVPAYPASHYISDQDYLPDEALAKIEANVPLMAQDFELQVANAWAKKVQVFFAWDRPDDVFKRADSIYALVEGAMCVDTLCKNLRAERESALVRYEVTSEQSGGSVIVVPRSFVESVMYSGAFEGEDLQRLWAQAEELLG